jgi:hypothetical protein
MIGRPSDIEFDSPLQDFGEQSVLTADIHSEYRERSCEAQLSVFQSWLAGDSQDEDGGSALLGGVRLTSAITYTRVLRQLTSVRLDELLAPEQQDELNETAASSDSRVECTSAVFV